MRKFRYKVGDVVYVHDNKNYNYGWGIVTKNNEEDFPYEVRLLARWHKNKVVSIYEDQICASKTFIGPFDKLDAHKYVDKKSPKEYPAYMPVVLVNNYDDVEGMISSEQNGDATTVRVEFEFGYVHADTTCINLHKTAEAMIDPGKWPDLDGRAWYMANPKPDSGTFEPGYEDD